MNGSSPDAYLRQVLSQYDVNQDHFDEVRLAAEETIVPAIHSWAGPALRGVSISGSHAKGTAIAGGSDLDLFISLKPNTTNSLSDIYWSLHQLALEKGWSPRAQTVSVGIKFNGTAIDLVPARLHAGVQNWHSLFNRRTESWMQTNVSRQVRAIAGSGRTDEIRLIKIWRNLHDLDFHSFYLELTVIEALRKLSKRLLAENVVTILEYIAHDLIRRQVVDPANSNNIISKDIGHSGKVRVATAALEALKASYWEHIIW